MCAEARQRGRQRFTGQRPASESRRRACAPACRRPARATAASAWSSGMPGLHERTRADASAAPATPPAAASLRQRTARAAAASTAVGVSPSARSRSRDRARIGGVDEALPQLGLARRRLRSETRSSSGSVRHCSRVTRVSSASDVLPSAMQPRAVATQRAACRRASRHRAASCSPAPSWISRRSVSSIRSSS